MPLSKTLARRAEQNIAQRPGSSSILCLRLPPFASRLASRQHCSCDVVTQPRHTASGREGDDETLDSESRLPLEFHSIIFAHSDEQKKES